MATVRLTHPRPDSLLVEVGRSWLVVALCGVLLAAWAGLCIAAWDSAALLVVMFSGAFLVPALAVVSVRSLKRQRLSLVRGQGKLLLDGEPIELARVELRMTHLPVTKVPTGYALSLWVMTSSGPVDVPLGRHRTLVEAARVSGAIEDFVQRAGTRQPGRTDA
jgi:hypothetical protein